MWVLISVGVLAGLIAGVSPCVLPVLPTIFFAAGVGPPDAGASSRHIGSGVPGPGTGSDVSSTGADCAGTNPAGTVTSRIRRPGRRPFLIIAGLVLSFAVFTLLGSAVLTALGLPQSFLRWAGLVVLLLIGLGLLFPPLEHAMQVPFRRLSPGFTRRLSNRSKGNGSALLLGLGLGVLYVPCAGPVLAAISIAGTAGQVTGAVATLTIAFSVGVAIPLLLFAFAGAGISKRLGTYRRRSRVFRTAAGATMVLLSVALTFNLTDGLQRLVPSYTQALQNDFEYNPSARAALAGVNAPQDPTSSGTPSPRAVPVPSSGPTPRAPVVRTSAADGGAEGPVVRCVSHARTLANCGPAAQFVGIQSWLNTPQNRPVTLAQLKGKVVLVNFWTFSCINCQRALPSTTAWYSKYHSSGLEVIGVHTPEFAYEHELVNVRQAVSEEGIKYPVALDNSSATWRNYHNVYWPAAYLVDARGVLRHVVYGEGGYTDSEALIRTLLRAADPGVKLPAPTNPTVPDS